jgi:hypothetical protein
MWGAFINGFKIIFLNIIVEKSKCRFPYLLRTAEAIPSQTNSHCMALLPSFPIKFYKRATIRQIS